MRLARPTKQQQMKRAAITAYCSGKSTARLQLSLFQNESINGEMNAMNPINDNAQLTALVSMFVGQLPILIISLLGCVVIMARKNELGDAATWALMGFGLSIVLCIVIPLAQTFVQ